MSLFRWGTKADGSQRTFREVYFGVDDKPKRKVMDREWNAPSNPPPTRDDVWVATTDGSVIYGWYDHSSKKWSDRILYGDITKEVVGWMYMDKPIHPGKP